MRITIVAVQGEIADIIRLFIPALPGFKQGFAGRKVKLLSISLGWGAVVENDWCIRSAEMNCWRGGTFLKISIARLGMCGHLKNLQSYLKHAPMFKYLKPVCLEFVHRRFLGFSFWRSFLRMCMSLAINTSASSMAVYNAAIFIFGLENG